MDIENIIYMVSNQIDHRLLELRVHEIDIML